MDTDSTIHPFVRIAFFTFAILSCFLLDSLEILVAFYVLVMIPLFLIVKRLSQHGYFVLIGIVPIILSYILIYILVLDEPNRSWDFIIVKGTKLLVFVAIFQFAFVLPSLVLMDMLIKLGLRGERLLILLSSITVPQDMIKKSKLIVDARFSRGFVGKRSLINQVKQLPFVLVPLLVGVLRTSQERARSWEQKNITNLLDIYTLKRKKTRYTLPINLIMLLSSILFFLITLFTYG